MGIQDVGMLFSFIGGLGLFLYGMNVMADGLQRSADGKLKNLMGFLTKNRFIGVVVGALITAIIQSSSATTVMVVGFVNAGMLNLAQAVGVIMGANIGTTITAWVVSMNEWSNVLKPDFFAPLIVGIGAFMVLFAKKENVKKAGNIMVGFGVLFIGLSFMSSAIEPYRDAEIFVQAFAILGRNPFLAIIAGALVTAIIQSSSASVGILQTLAMTGVVNWQSAVFITLGQNIGTCITALLSSAGAGKNAKRASIIHLLFNTIGSLCFGVVMFILFKMNAQWASASINSIEISIFHTIFNVLCTVCLFPFANQLVNISKIIIRDSKDEQEEESIVEEASRRLDRRILNNPEFAIETAIHEIVFMGKKSLENAKISIESVKINSKDLAKKVYANEKTINELEKMLTTFLIDVGNLSLTESQQLAVKDLFFMINDFGRIGDHSENIAEISDKKRKDKIEFSNKAQKDLEKITIETIAAIKASIEALETRNQAAVIEVGFLEEKVDKLEAELRDKHIQRLTKGKCVPESGVLFLEIMSNLERMSDHASNVASYIEEKKAI